MNILTTEGISKSYGIRTLFQDINITITDEQKIGLIGINGTGKSTFLRVLAGSEAPDTGSVTIMKGAKIEILSQNPEFVEEATILEQVFHGESKEINTIRAYEEALEQVMSEPENEKFQTALMTLSEEMKLGDLWDFESQVKTILTKLGVHDFTRKMGQLSGGQRKRIALAAALITPCDLLILDEPTNHMDNSTIDWLENFLKNRHGALLMITHDRYFLDRVVNQTIELDDSNLYTYAGNYTEFIEKKLERREQLVAFEKKRQNLYRTELKWIRRGVQGRGTKQNARVQRFEILKDAKVDLSDDELDVCIRGSRLGNKIIEIEKINKSYGDLQVVKDFSYTLLREDRIGIIGDNGMGKSTLLKLIVGGLNPDSGIVEIGQTVKIGYFSQESEEMDLNMSAIDYIKETAEYRTTTRGKYLSAAQLMETFLFTSKMQYTQIERLSGGEKRRLFLLKILMDEPNILILDEPTNDLDIDTLKVLENYMDSFEGPVITVSHDRYFLDRTCDKIFAFSQGGQIDYYPGNYTDYRLRIEEENVKSGNLTSNNLRKVNASVGQAKGTRTTSEEINKSKQQQKQGGQPTKRKFTYKEKLEFEKIYDEIELLEKRLEDIEKSLTENSSNYTKLEQLNEENEEVEMALLEKLERQEYLEAILNEE